MKPAPAFECQPGTKPARRFVPALLLCLALVGCGERASTWDDRRGRYVSTDDYRRDQINREIDKRELERERGR